MKDDVLAVVGGCSVSVQSEVIGSTIGPTETKNLIDLSNTLQVGWQAIIVDRGSSSSGGTVCAKKIQYVVVQYTKCIFQSYLNTHVDLGEVFHVLLLVV